MVRHNRSVMRNRQVHSREMVWLIREQREIPSEAAGKDVAFRKHDLDFSSASAELPRRECARADAESLRCRQRERNPPP